MSNKILFLLLSLLFCFVACEEVGPGISPPSVNNDNTNDPTEEVVRRVLVEEFTGVQCVNCPQGAQIIENLINVHGDKVVAISIHSGFFSDPLPQSQLDLSTDQGNQIDALVGPAEGYPSAAINRKGFGGSSLVLTAGTWVGHITDELSMLPKVDVKITNTYEASSRNLQAVVEVPFLETVTGDLNLSVLLVENDIVDAQLDTSGLIEDYTHKHVFRTMLTNIAGDPISTLAVGESTTATFNHTLPTAWNADKCKVIAFVHHAAPTLEVLQAAEQSL